MVITATLSFKFIYKQLLYLCLEMCNIQGVPHQIVNRSELRFSGLTRKFKKNGFQFPISYFYLTTKQDIIQIINPNLLCSLDPPNQSWLF